MDSHERAVTRCEILRLGVTASVAAIWVPHGLLWGWDEKLLSATASTVAGPFYPLVRPLERDTDLTRLAGHSSRAKGQIIHVVGRVLSQRGEPIAGAHVELWQANTFGRYDHPSDPNPAPLDPDFQGYAAQFTDREGRFRRKRTASAPNLSAPSHFAQGGTHAAAELWEEALERAGGD
jgi:protocatechuate 3,4-dioxygenase beta subunit